MTTGILALSIFLIVIFLEIALIVGRNILALYIVIRWVMIVVMIVL